jgi:hypothetical protein
MWRYPALHLARIWRELWSAYDWLRRTAGAPVASPSSAIGLVAQGIEHGSPKAGVARSNRAGAATRGCHASSRRVSIHASTSSGLNRKVLAEAVARATADRLTVARRAWPRGATGRPRGLLPSRSACAVAPRGRYRPETRSTFGPVVAIDLVAAKVSLEALPIERLIEVLLELVDGGEHHKARPALFELRCQLFIHRHEP